MAHASSRDPRLLHHPLAAQTVVFAPRRAERPRDIAGDGAAAIPCPFCAGHEADTPPHVLRHPDDQTRPWQARIIPNRYPIVERAAGFSPRTEAANSPERDLPCRQSVPFSRPAHGIHEVVIESAEHCRSILEVDPTAWRDVWHLVQRRLAMLDDVPGLAWATIFKNSGPAAGASLEHLHSQLVALDFVPPVMEAKLAAASRPGQSFSDVIRQAEADGRLVAERDDVVAIVSPTPRQPFETWILPRQTEPLFSAASRQRVAAVADLTRHVVARLGSAIPGADYNWWLHQAPSGRPAKNLAERWHWHLEILPRLAPLAGFELATGCHITTLSPAESAERMLSEGEQ